jgi:hypothetical protein
MTPAADAILLYRVADGWVAYHQGPHAEEIRRLFGTDTLPTGFTRHADRLTVVHQIQALNPDCAVRAV